LLQPVRQGAFDAAEGLMLRFSSGFYVGSMKNVPPALLAGNTITAVLAPALALSANALPVHFKSGDLRRERTALIGFANDA